jgi:hypothetical protein
MNPNYKYNTNINILKGEDYKILENHLDKSNIKSQSEKNEMLKYLRNFNKNNDVDKHIKESQYYYKDYLKLYNQKQEYIEKIKQNPNTQDIQKYIQLNNSMNKLTSKYNETLKLSVVYNK